MDRAELYHQMASRKDKPKDYEPYAGDNGRVNKCVDLMRASRRPGNHPRISAHGTLLDVGGGIGDLGYAVRDLFEKTITFDISEVSLRAARAKGNISAKGDVDRDGLSQFDDTSIDVITALDFIEHIVDPENFARECYRVLKPSGEVFINTPNIRFWRHIQQLWRQGTFPHTSGDREVFHGGHLAFFTYSDLRAIFEPAGFTSVEQIRDEECFEQPPEQWIQHCDPRNQQDYVRLCLELGCPNLLYKAVCTK